AGWRLDAVAEAPLRMIEPARDDFRAVNRELLAAGHFLEFALRAHSGKVHGKIRGGHLGFEDLLQAVAAEELRAETIEVEFVRLDVKRRGKRDALDGVPAGIRDANVRVRLLRVARAGAERT